MIRVCDFAPSPTATCGLQAYYCTTTTDANGITQQGPDLCDTHLGARVASLLGRYKAVHVAEIGKGVDKHV